MELRHLRYFVAVAEAEHFGRAARQLHVSASPLSRQIAQLEDELGTELFVPSGRGVKLTAAGRSFLDGARATLARAALAIEDARAAAQGRIGTVVIGFEGGMAYGGLLPRVVEQFRARHPEAVVRLLPMQSEQQVAALREGTISVGYGYHPPEPDPSVRFKVLFRDRLGVVLPKKHRLAARRSLRLADLKGERFIWWPRKESPLIYDALIGAFRARKQPLDIAHEQADGEALFTLVESGEGLSFFAESSSAMVRLGTVLKPLVDLDVVILGRTVWRTTDERDPLVRSLLELTHSLHAGKESRARRANAG